MAMIVGVIAVTFLLLIGTMVFVLYHLRAVRAQGGQAAAQAAPQPSLEEHLARSYPLRRPAMRKQMALFLCLVLLADIVVAGGAAAYFQYRSVHESQLLQREGVVTRGRVVALEISEDDDGGETYYVTYTFVSRPGRPEEREITRRDSVPRDLYERLEEGSRIEIIYAPSEPGVARVMVDYVPGSIDYFPAVMGAAIVLPALGGLLWSFSRYRRCIRLDEQGVTATAEVLDMYQEGDGESVSYYIALQLPGDTPFRYAVRRSVYQGLQVGSPVAIRYLPDDPRVFRLE